MMRHGLFLMVIIFFAVSSKAGNDNVPEPFEWATALTLEAVGNTHGGVAKGTKSLGNLDATLTIDTAQAGWWDGGTWFVYVLGNYGKNPSDMTGDLQTLSNISTDNALKVYEFWYEQRFANDAVKLLVGLHDYNSTFYALDSAGLFTVSSFGIGPDTAQVSPSIFSTTATAVQLTFQQRNMYLLLAVYDGVPGDPNNPRGTHVQFNRGDGLFNAAELGFMDGKKYKIAIGGWQKTTEEKNVINGQLSNQNHGYYIIGEKNISENLTAFFQYGRADDAKNQLDEYTGAGLRLNNVWQENDAVGLGVAIAHNGAPYVIQNANIETAETILELTYFRPLVTHLNGQASIYYVKNPSMSPLLDNALALGLRLYIEY